MVSKPWTTGVKSPTPDWDQVRVLARKANKLPRALTECVRSLRGMSVVEYWSWTATDRFEHAQRQVIC